MRTFILNESLSETQGKKILSYIKEHGSITTREASKLGITSMHRRLTDLENRGYCFNREITTESFISPEGRKVTIHPKKYTLID